MGGGHTHLIDCWVRFVRERWTEYERRNKVAVCLSLSWRKSRQNGTGNSRPEEEEKRQREGEERIKNGKEEKRSEVRAC